MDDLVDLVADGAAELAALHGGHDWRDDLTPLNDWSARLFASLITPDVEELFELLGYPDLDGCVPAPGEDPTELASRIALEARLVDIITWSEEAD